MKKTFQDGDTVELAMSENTMPPGHVGQAGSKSTTWFRVNGGEWEAGSSRAMHNHRQALECADDVLEFRQLLEIL